MTTIAEAVQSELKERPVLKLDLGCGKNKREGFLGVDRRLFEGVDAATDLMTPGRWAFAPAGTHKDILAWGEPLDSGRGISLADSSVVEVHCSHFLEHLTGPQRVKFLNELHRVLMPGAKATIITPHWASNRAYGDFTHQWPPVSEMLFWYLNREWRRANAPDNDSEWNPEGYTCDFDFTYGYGMHQTIMSRNTEYQNFAMTWYKEACQDIHCTLTVRK